MNTMRSLISRLFKKKEAPVSRKADTQYPLKIPGIGGQLSMVTHEVNDAHISTTIRREGIWEPEETRFIIEALKTGDTFVDVGANIGYFSVLASRLAGAEGRVIAFEPDPENFRLLEENCKNNSCRNVTCHEAALSDTTGRGELFLSDTNMGDHTIYPVEEQRKSESIALIRGEELLPAESHTIDFLKIDTQGSEYQVIKGLQETIEASLPGLIVMVEFSPNSVTKTGYSGGAFLDLFASGGYFYVLDSQHCGLIPISLQQLRHWTNLTEMDPTSEGFINLIFAGSPLETQGRFKMVQNLGFYDNALEYLLGNTLPPWNGESVAALSMQEQLYFASGWSFFEQWGTWSDGGESIIKFFVGDNLKRCTSPALIIRGRYFGDKEDTSIEVNNIPLGAFDLQDAAIPLPQACLRAEYITLKLKHRYPTRPTDLGDSSDDRQLKFGLESMAIDVREPADG